MKNKYLLILWLLLAGQLIFAQNGKKLFDNSVLHEIRWNFSEPDYWQLMTDNYQNSIDQNTGVPTDVPYLQGTVSIDGEVIDSVGLRQKGFSSYFASNEFKKSLKVDFNEFVPGKNFDGIKKFNLANGVGDPGFQRDMTCYNLMRKAGIRAPRTAFAKVFLNDEYWGLYVIIEQVDKTFLNANFADGNGNLYKNIGWSNLEYMGSSASDYSESIALRTNEDSPDWSDYIEFVRVLDQTPQNNFKKEIEKVFNVDYFLRVLAIDVMTNNWDSYMEHGRNFYLYHEPTSDQFYWIPWDYNLAMGGNFDFGGGPPSDPENCPSILSGSCPYSADDSIFLQVIDKFSFCCNDEWAQVCQDTYDFLAKTDTCESILNGSCPYSPDDPVFQEVATINPSCCDNTWDSQCQTIYDDIKQFIGGGIFYQDFDLIQRNSEKSLISKILEVPEYRERYLNYSCQILDGNFSIDKIAPVIDATADLITDAVEDDLNLNSSFDAFLYDVSEGSDNPTGSIPSLKQFINHRIPLLEEELNDLNHNCSDALAPIDWHDVVINEFVASNDSTSGIVDQDGEADDWLELHNNTSDRVDLTDFFLSDNYDNPLKWSFPAGTTLEPNGYLIVWADENGMEEGLHANFKLAKSGESIMLVHSDGTYIDSLSYGQQTTNVPSARVPDGTGNFVMQDPTFNANNDGESGVGEIAENRFVIYPNPAHSILNIEFEKVLFTEKGNIRLRNMLGQIMISESLQGIRQTQLNVSGLTPGIYFAEIEIGKERQTLKIFVE